MRYGRETRRSQGWIMIRMIAMDMDGTLLDYGLNIAPRAVETLREAAKRGVMVTIATGRMFDSAVQFAERLNLDAPLITYNGALIRSLISKETYLHRPMNYEHAHRVLEIMDRHDVSVTMYFDDKLYVKEVDKRVQGYVDIGKVTAYPVGNMVEFLDGEAQKIARTGVGMPITAVCDDFEQTQINGCAESGDTDEVRVGPTKMLAIGEPEDLALLREELLSEFRDCLYITGSLPQYLELMHKGVSKAYGLRVLGEMCGIARQDILAVGDSHNDIEMIEYAGIGVAVGNAVPEAKEKADYVAETSFGDGVAEAIEKFILSNGERI